MIISGVASVISGSKNVNILAHLVSVIGYDDLYAMTSGQLSFTRQDYDAFIAEQGKALVEVGALDQEFVATGQVLVRM